MKVVDILFLKENVPLIKFINVPITDDDDINIICSKLTYDLNFFSGYIVVIEDNLVHKIINLRRK